MSVRDASGYLARVDRGASRPPSARSPLMADVIAGADRARPGHDRRRDRRPLAVRRQRGRPGAGVRRRPRRPGGRRRPRPGRAAAAHDRAAILDRAADLLAARRRGVRPDHRRGGGQADQDGPGRGRAGPSATFTLRRGRGPHAHRRDGPDGRVRAPARASSAFTLRVPIGVVGAISPFNFPLNLVAHKVAPGDRRRLPGRAQAGVARRRSRRIALAELLLDECGLPAGLAQRRHRRRRHGRQRARRPPRHRA